MDKDRLATDIAKHFGNRLRTVLDDTIHTCKAGDLELDDALGVVIPALLFELALAVQNTAIPREVFIDMCATSYDRMERAIAKAHARHRRGQ